MDKRFPIGKLQVPEEVTDAHVQQWLKEVGMYDSLFIILQIHN